MKSWKVLVSVAFLIAVLGFVLYATLPHSRGGYRFEDAAQVVVDDIVAAIHLYRIQQGEFSVNESADSEIWSSSILPLLLAKGYIGYAYGTESNMVFDPLGNPCNVHIRGLTIASNEFDKTFGKDVGDVVVWSIGRNEIDELGKGDDIINSSAKKSKSGSHGGCSLSLPPAR
jgi:hypothetical protein